MSKYLLSPSLIQVLLYSRLDWLDLLDFAYLKSELPELSTRQFTWTRHSYKSSHRVRKPPSPPVRHAYSPPTNISIYYLLTWASPLSWSTIALSWFSLLTSYYDESMSFMP